MMTFFYTLSQSLEPVTPDGETIYVCNNLKISLLQFRFDSSLDNEDPTFYERGRELPLSCLSCNKMNLRWLRISFKLNQLNRFPTVFYHAFQT